MIHEGAVGAFDGSLHQIDYDELESAEPLTKNSKGASYEVNEIGWLGFTDKYWLSALAPADKQPYRAVFETLTGARGQPIYRARTIFPPQTAPAGGKIELTTHLFAGAKEVSVIRDYQYLFDGQAEPQASARGSATSSSAPAPRASSTPSTGAGSSS